jgi:hypothetical protein
MFWIPTFVGMTEGNVEMWAINVLDSHFRGNDRGECGNEKKGGELEAMKSELPPLFFSMELSNIRPLQDRLF